MDEKQFQELKGKLNMIAKLLTLSMVKDMKSQKDQIIALSSYGFKPSEVAELLGTTANTVSVTLSKVKKKK